MNNTDFLVTENTLQNINKTDSNTNNSHIQVQHTENNVNHEASQGTNVPPGEVFPTLLKSLGEHHDFSFFHIHLIDLPVIIYDKEAGFHTYSSVNTMSQAGVFTTDHVTHKIVKSNNHQSPTLDLSVTSLVCFQWMAMLLMIFMFFKVKGKYKNPKKAPKGLQNVVESAIIFLRDQVVGPNIGGKHITDRLLPYFVVLFFFILFMNFLGLLPGGHTATGAIGTTAALAVCSMFVINWTSIREVGLGNYLKHLMGGAPWWLSFIMVPIEILSIFTKPFALTVRLFANMTAGHVVLLSLVGLIFYFKSFAVAPVSVIFSVFMFVLEILVAFLQAYIFTILTAVFTGLGTGSHDHEAHTEHSQVH